MIPESFEYHIPKTLAEASRLVAQFGGEGKILAGGHSLVPLMKLRLAAPAAIAGAHCPLSGARCRGAASPVVLAAAAK